VHCLAETTVRHASLVVHRARGRSLYMLANGMESGTLSLLKDVISLTTIQRPQRSLSFSGDFRHTMCFQIVERYSVCRCVFQEYGIDECPLYQHKGHVPQVQVILIGVLCLRCLYRRQVPERGLFRSETGSEKLPDHRRLKENECLQTTFT
jgi:hypothetical protein